MKYRTRPRRLGFTLIELLVVIAIIAVLVALMFPAFARVRFKMKCLQCASNLHQWGIACNLYSADNRGFLPRFDLTGGPSGEPWDIGWGYAGPSNNAYYGYFPRILSEYGMPSTNFFFCPVAKNDGVNFTGGAGGALRYGACFYTHFNCYIFWVARNCPMKGSDIPKLDAYGTGAGGLTNLVYSSRDPREYPIMSDNVRSALVGGFPVSQYDTSLDGSDNALHQWNGKLDNCNVLYANGRVEVHRRSEIRDRIRTGWCDLFY